LEDFKGLRQIDCKLIKFTAEHDASVAHSGMEVVTDKLCGDNFVVGMSELAQIINERGCIAGPTTGLHVHVDAIDYNTLDLRRAFVLFATIQNQLFGTLVAASRKTNQFCPPLLGSKEALLNLINLTKPSEINRFFYNYLYDIELKDIPNLLAADSKAYVARVQRVIQQCKSKKYMNQARRQALNFHSWMMRGTLEFRLHEGTTDFDDLLMWPLWCGWFVQRTLGISDKEVQQWVSKPPSIIELSERFAEGKTAMPKNILEWVKRKCTGQVAIQAQNNLNRAMENLWRQGPDGEDL
jgi:hypothetical protein